MNNEWFETSEGSEFRIDSVLAVTIEEQGEGEFRCSAIFQGGKYAADLTHAEALQVKFRMKRQPTMIPFGKFVVTTPKEA